MSEPKKTLVEGLKVEEGASEPDWWTEAAQDVIRHAKTDSSPDWRNAIVGGLLRAYNRGKDVAAQHLKREQESRRTTQEIAEAVVASYNGGFVREMQRVPRPGLVALVKEALDVERGQPREQEPAPREIVYKAIFDGCTHIEQTTRSDGKCEVCWGVACYVSQALAVQPPQELVSLREALQSVIDERDTELDMMHCPYTNGTREHDAWHQGVREAWERFDVVKRKARAALTRGAVGGGK